MNFNYDQDGTGSTLPAYARVLLDCLLGDQMLFWRQDGVELSWRFLAPLLGDSPGTTPHPYPAGSFGPEAAARLMNRPVRPRSAASSRLTSHTISAGPPGDSNLARKNARTLAMNRATARARWDWGNQ